MNMSSNIILCGRMVLNANKIQLSKYCTKLLYRYPGFRDSPSLDSALLDYALIDTSNSKCKCILPSHRNVHAFQILVIYQFCLVAARHIPESECVRYYSVEKPHHVVLNKDKKWDQLNAKMLS